MRTAGNGQAATPVQHSDGARHKGLELVGQPRTLSSRIKQALQEETCHGKATAQVETTFPQASSDEGSLTSLQRGSSINLGLSRYSQIDACVIMAAIAFMNAIRQVHSVPSLASMLHQCRAHD